MLGNPTRRLPRAGALFGVAVLAAILSWAFSAGALRAIASDAPFVEVRQAVGSQASDASATLTALFDEAWEYRLAEDPLFATYVGDRRYNDRLPDESLARQRARLEASRKFLARLEAIDRSRLARNDQINYDIYRRLLKDDIAEGDFESYLTPITNRSGFHVSFPEMPQQVPLDTVEDYDNYIARLRAFGRYTDDHIELMTQGLKQGYTLPAVVLRDFERPITAHVVDDPTQSMLYGPIARFPDTIPAPERERLAGECAAAIRESVVPAYSKFLAFMKDQYVPEARGSVGISALPKGRDYYRFRVKHFTTLDLTPEEVHQKGLDEVARIRQEMAAVIARTGFKGDFAAFVEMLRTDPKFYVDDPEKLLKEVSFVLKKMDGKLPELFGRLPRTPYGIREVPPYIAPGTTTAYYMQPSGDGTRAGFYYVNTFNLGSRPLYEIEALSLHEAVPGHHLQIALQQEMKGLPQFRRFAGITAFVEGWGLYAERLGLDVGFYEDPYSDFGRLSYEMWRACRLVVDSGMHYLGWSRQQAIDFMAENTALSLHNITAEVDRYISWPGQALAYKMGELKLREMRQLAEDELGKDFDIRAFHDVVLADGAVPLDVLEANVKQYISQAKQAAQTARSKNQTAPQVRPADVSPPSVSITAPAP